jgi:hypothetical protein
LGQLNKTAARQALKEGIFIESYDFCGENGAENRYLMHNKVPVLTSQFQPWRRG